MGAPRRDKRVMQSLFIPCTLPLSKEQCGGLKIKKIVTVSAGFFHKIIIEGEEELKTKKEDTVIVTMADYNK